VGGWRGDGNDGGRGVVGSEVWRVQLEHALVVVGGQVPYADRVVAGAGEEGVGGGAECDGGHGVGMASEVANEGVVVGGKVADCVCRASAWKACAWRGLRCTVDFCAGEDDALSMVGEARQVDAILLALELLGVLALLAIVYLERVVVARDHGELSCVVKVERGDGRGGRGGLEALRGGVSGGTRAHGTGHQAGSLVKGGSP
jgi:hypothetical protein